MRDRRVARLWAGQLCASTGWEFYGVAIIWVATGFVGEAAGYLAAVQAGALLAGSLFGGIVADRFRHRTTMIAADLSRAVLCAALSLAAGAGLLTLGLLGLVTVLNALIGAVFDPALQASLPELVPDPAARWTANGLFDATRRMARLLAASLVALVARVVPSEQFFTLTAVALLASAASVRAALRPGPPPGRAAGLAAIIESVAGGARAVRGRRLVLYALASSFVLNAAWAIGIQLGLILYLRQVSAAPLTEYGLVMAAYGAGNLASNVAVAAAGPGDPRRQIAGSKLLFGVGLALMPLVPHPYGLMAAAAVTSLNGPMGDLAMLHLVQTGFAAHRLAQVFRLQMCMAFAGQLLAFALAPALIAAFGIVPVIVAAGCAPALTGAAGWFVREAPGRGSNPGPALDQAMVTDGKDARP